MFSLPNPLHPAVVHFPIVLIILGAAVAVAAAFLRRWQLPAIAAVLLALGAVGSFVGGQTGETEGDRFEKAPALKAVLHAHEVWAERTQVAAVVVALLAVAAATTGRWPMAARSLGAVAAAAALVAAWCVFEAGHYGGQLVYRHGAGVSLAGAGGAAIPTGKNSGEAPRPNRDRDRHK